MARNRFSKSELERYRKMLVERLVVLFNAVHADVRAALWDTPLREEAGDEGDEAERVRMGDFYARLDERNAALAQAMEAALRRIRRGEYGACVDCGEPIERERLAIVPWALRCSEDQQRFEREQPAPHGAPP